MKIYNIKLKIKKKVIHEEFIRTNLNQDEISSAFKPPYADIEISEVKDFIPTLDSPAKSETVEPKKEYVEFSFDKDMSDEESSEIRQLIQDKENAKREYDLFSDKLAHKYYGLSNIEVKNLEMVAKPTIKKLTFSGLISVKDIVNL